MTVILAAIDAYSGGGSFNAGMLYLGTVFIDCVLIVEVADAWRNRK